MRPLPDRHGVVFWGALAAGFLVAQQVMGKATRDALFLSYHPATSLPPLMMASALVAVASALVVGRLLASRSPRQVVPALIGVNAGLLLGQFLLAQAAPRLAASLFYLQVAATGGSLLSGFWSVVSERFDPWTAKQVVSRLGLGASVGGVAGGTLAFAVARAVPVATLLLLTAALNVAALVGLVRFGGDAPPAAGGRERGDLSPFGTLRSVPYLRLLALLVALGAGAEALLDYVLKSRASASLASGPQLMAFFGAYHTGMGLLALLGQGLVRPALQGLGLAGTVALRPLVVVAASLVGLVDPRLWSAVLGRGSHDVLSNSVFRSGYELLYTPLPEAEKRATKQVVDVAFDKLGALAGGALTLAAVRLLGAPDQALLVAAAGLCLLALLLTPGLRRGYVATLEESLRAGKVHLDLQDVVDSATRLTLVQTGVTGVAAARAPRTPAGLTDPLLLRIADLRSGQAERVRRALGGAEAPELGLVPHLVPLLRNNAVYLDVLRALRGLAPRCTGQLLDTILDEGADVVVRRRLPRVLKAAPGPRTVEGLLRGADDRQFQVRAACGAALAALAGRASEQLTSGEQVFAVVRRELARAEAPQGASPETPDKAAVLGHVFNLLSLVLNREPLKIAAGAIGGSDARLRGTALEYLENVLPPDLRASFLRFVQAPESGRARPASEVLSDLLESGQHAGLGRRQRRLRPRD